jgi:acetyltransferase EpsM
MTDATPIRIPLINPNEPECLLVEVFVEESQRISEGEPLCSLETTKSAQVLSAPSDGFILGIRFNSGQIVRAGEIFCYLADSPDWQLPELTATMTGEAEDFIIPDGLRITQRALSLVRAKNINLKDLPQGPLITEEVILEMLEPSADFIQSPSSEFDPSAIIIYGGGGHGKSLIDLLRQLRKYHIVGIIDDGIPIGEEIMGVPVIGGREILSELYAKGVRTAVNAVGGIGNMSIRIQVFKEIAAVRFICPTVIHPTAFIEPSAVLGSGIQVFPHAYVGSQSRIGFGVIVNTSAIISHDCMIDDYTNISPGAVLAGEVKVGKGVLIGMGATINLQVTIGDRSRIGNGATIKSDVPGNGIVRAGSIWPE